ncbi:LEC14B protein [Linum perenne]
MFFVAVDPSIDEMGYAMSRLEIESQLFDEEEETVNEVGGGSQHKSKKESAAKLDHEVAQDISLKSQPHRRLEQEIPGKRDFPVSPVKMLAGREANLSGRGRFSGADRCHIISRYLPVDGPWLVDRMNSRAYVSQFSSDGSLFVAGFQGSHIKIYNVEKGWKVQKDIRARSLRWTVTDTSLSPDQRFLVYASMCPIVHIVNIESSTTESVANVTEIHDGLDFSDEVDGGYTFGIFSVKFSTDGRELVAGCNDDAIYVYDLEANKVSERILAHTVWDRRCLIARGKPAGVLTGHVEGITCIDSRGDGRYFISNGKDQTIKLWDIRKMAPSSTCNSEIRDYEWDYRWMDYPAPARDLKHPCDQSVATYKGHSVLRTLIRCYFSPAYSTGQKYIYTGSHDSSVYIYDVVTGEIAGVLKHHNSPVRDCSWHPHYPMLVSSSWDGDIMKWEFVGNGEAPTPMTKKRLRRRQFY